MSTIGSSRGLAEVNSAGVASKLDRARIGWREWVVLGDFTLDPIKAKVDTGAATSSLHASALELVPGPAGMTACFDLQPKQGLQSPKVRVECPVVGFKKVRSSNGLAELRPVVRTEIAIGAHDFSIDVTLTSRDSMGFRMLIGRRALKKRFLVDPSRSFLHGQAVSAEGRTA